MITINLYDYKRVIRDVGIQKNLAMVFTIFVLTLGLCGTVWTFQKMWTWKIEGELTEVQAKVKQATPDYNAVQKLKKQQGQYKKIITGIDKLRSQQARTTEFLEDMAGAVPEGIWLTSIKQMSMPEIKKKQVPFLFISYDAKKAKKRRKRGQKNVDKSGDKFIELRGMAMDDQAVIHFLDKLRGIPYIDAVVLHTSKREWMENQPVQKFDVYCHFLKT
jgi:Tfp pilus assembly protein PilN